MKLFDIFMNDTVNKTETFVLDNWLLGFFFEFITVTVKQA